MDKQIINIGTGELAGDGESIRSAFAKVNTNFDQLFAFIESLTAEIEGGSAATVYSPSNFTIDGGSASTIFTNNTAYDGGGA